MKKKVAAGLAAIALIAAILASCPNPIDSSALKEMTDETNPVVTINSPAQGSAYTQTVTVQGTATDNGRIRVVSYQVSGTLGLLKSGSIDGSALGAGGAFTFQFSTISFNGPIVVTVAAEDWNDNTAEDSVTLQYSGSAVSSFTAVPGSKEVQLSWEAVPDATGYTIYYTTNGTLPSQSYGTQIPLKADASSYNLTGLANGALHIFVLRAQRSSGSDLWSAALSVIPLSPLTLAPAATGGFRQITLEWSAIPATDEFEILRATSGDGPFENYSGTIHGNSFTDTGVVDGQWYYYKVRPTLAGSIASGANAAETARMPPDDTERVTSIGLPAQAGKLRVTTDEFAYVAAGTAGLMVIDVSSPNWPAYVNTVSTGGDAKDLVINGDTLYLANGSEGLAVFDISRREAPAKIGECRSYSTYTIGDAAAVSIVPAYNRVFVLDASGDTAVFAIDAATPSSPTAVSRYSNASYRMTDLEAVYYSNYFLIYIGTTPGGGACLLELYQSVSAGAQLTYYRTYTNPDYTPTRITTSGSHIYCLAYANMYLEPPPPYELMILNNAVSFSPPTLVGQYSTSLNGSLGDIRADSSLGRVYTADGIGMRIFNVSTPASPQMLKYYDTPGSPSGVDIDPSGSHVYVGSGVFQFQSVDLTSPASPAVIGTWGTNGVHSAAVRGPYAFASATGPSRLEIIDVSNPAGPTSVAGGSLSMSAGNVKVHGPYAFVTGGSQGVHIVDITDPASPALVHTVPLGSGSANTVEVRGDFMYVAASGRMYVFDIGVPTSPLWVGVHDADGASSINDVKIRGNRAYVTDGAYFQSNSLKILDISDPSNPLLAGKTTNYPGQTINRLALDGDWVFVTDQAPATSGLYAVSIDPANVDYLRFGGSCPTVSAGNYGTAQGLAVYGGYAYVADNATGTDSTTALAQMNVADPATLSDSSRVNTLDWSTSNGNSTAEDVVLSGKYAYVSDSTFGLKVIRLFP